MKGNFESKYEYAIDLLDNYSNMVNDGHKLSVQQRKQIMEILSLYLEMLYCFFRLLF